MYHHAWLHVQAMSSLIWDTYPEVQIIGLCGNCMLSFNRKPFSEVQYILALSL